MIQSHSPRYRTDIQGLRGVAVIFVIAYHAKTFATGGFVGVDIFFVVSGYVITKMLVFEIEETGQIQLRKFYLRRIRRLLPALGVMLTIVLILSTGLVAVGTQITTARTGFGSSLINANNYLLKFGGGGGYFGTTSDTNPLLHTWSLSIEEQFYLVFPGLLAIASYISIRRRRTSDAPVKWLLGTIIGISLILSVSLTFDWPHISQSGTNIAFYSAPTRAWEFSSGAIIGAFATRISKRTDTRVVRFVAAPIGALLLISSLLLFNETTRFPGTAAIIPVVGTMLLIASGEDQNGGPATSILSWSPLTKLGDMSYSLYLWQQPMIVFAATLWPTSGYAKLAGAAVSIAPAWISYTFIEKPIRYRKTPRALQTVRISFLSVVTPMVAALLLLLANQRLMNTNIMQDMSLHADVTAGCESSTPYGERGESCRWPAQNSNGEMVLIGDSNAGQFTEGVVAAANARGLDVVVATMAACPFVNAAVSNAYGDSRHDSACRNFVSRSMDRLIDNRPDLVMIASASDLYIEMEKDSIQSFTGIAVAHTPGAKAKVWEVALKEIINQLSSAGIKIIIASPVPRLSLDWEPINMAPVRMILGGVDGVNSGVERSTALRERSRALTAEHAASVGSAVTLDVFDELCPTEMCWANDGRSWVFRDATHISVASAVMLTGSIDKALGRALVDSLTG